MKQQGRPECGRRAQWRQMRGGNGQIGQADSRDLERMFPRHNWKQNGRKEAGSGFDGCKSPRRPNAVSPRVTPCELRSHQPPSPSVWRCCIGPDASGVRVLLPVAAPECVSSTHKGYSPTGSSLPLNHRCEKISHGCFEQGLLWCFNPALASTDRALASTV